ncbi:MAG: Glu-tRNA(Gln) amidotransferase GatDE subunit E [Candidatus Altiarchaeales archaeon HGW-Altiarchaeales-1]|nr:MAG: Glu-tRNA(Gln) amidotransferase GatDE subunit E [Candidatus Altiarchaeales archaeon HGW-Altiarchaeales-1]
MPHEFKCGIEICSCPSILREDEPQIIVRRRMRAVAGETGEVDKAAMQEVLKNREIVYQAYRDTNCLVELDEEPPHNINEDALTIVLKFCLLVNAHIADKIQVMRKTVIDGSNTSGFQRTSLVGYDGKISTSLGDVTITSICLEEDAARKISESEDEIIYRVDRLGVPLIEITTDPSILNPQHAKETAEKIGTILRTLEVKRGIGTIRQDVNVSIEGGARVEIKGCQELNLIPKILEYEIKRQEMLIAVREELNARGTKSEQLGENFIALCEIFKNTQCTIIKSAIENQKVCYGVKLKNFSSLLGSKFCGISKEPRLGKEISRYVKTGTKLKGLFHSDELPNYGISEDEIKEVRKILSCCESDAKFIEKVRKNLPEPIDSKFERYASMVGKELANQLIHSKISVIFDKFAEKYKVKPSAIAGILLSAPKEIKKKYGIEFNIEENLELCEKVLKFIEEKRISYSSVSEIFYYAKKEGKDKYIGDVIKERNLGLATGDEILTAAREIIAKDAGIAANKIMREFKGRANIEDVEDVVNGLL